MRCSSLALVLFLLSLAGPVRALTLQDLDAGASFASSDGSITFAFDPGSVVANGSLPGSLLDYLVTPIVGGFQISGPLAAANGALGGLTLSFGVTPTLSLLIDSASLVITGVAVGSAALGSAGTTLSNGVGLGVLVSSFGSSPLAAASFAPASALQVVTGIQLITLGAGDVAAIQALRQTFTLVPEARTALLLASGLLGLALFGSQPRRAPAPARRAALRRG